MQQPERILIVLMGSLGDVARGLALPGAIKRRLPQSSISWLVETASAPLVALHPQIDKIYIFDRKRWFREVPRLKQEFQAAGFDLTLDLQRHLKSGFFSRLSGASRRVGFHKANAKEFNWLFNTETLPAFPADYPKIHHYLEFARHLGRSAETIVGAEPVDFGFSSFEPEKHAAPWHTKTGRGFIGIVLGSSWESKDWPEEHYYSLISELLESRPEQLVLLGDKRKQTLGAALKMRFPDPRLINLCAQTSLPQLCGLIALSALCLGPDSGPGHLASVFGRPYISLFGPSDPRRVAPYGSEHLVISAGTNCAPCMKRRCPGLGGICMSQISPQQVLAVLDRLL